MYLKPSLCIFGGKFQTHRRPDHTAGRRRRRAVAHPGRSAPEWIRRMRRRVGGPGPGPAARTSRGGDCRSLGRRRSRTGWRDGGVRASGSWSISGAATAAADGAVVVVVVDDGAKPVAAGSRNCVLIPAKDRLS